MWGKKGYGRTQNTARKRVGTSPHLHRRVGSTTKGSSEDVSACRASCHSIGDWSCIRPLRIIHSTPKPATMSPLPHHLRGHCHGTTSLFLPTRSRSAGVRLPDALLAVAQRRRFPSPADRANHAIPTQALPGTPTVCWPDPATAVRPV